MKLLARDVCLSANDGSSWHIATGTRAEDSRQLSEPLRTCADVPPQSAGASGAFVRRSAPLIGSISSRCRRWRGCRRFGKGSALLTQLGERLLRKFATGCQPRDLRREPIGLRHIGAADLRRLGLEPRDLSLDGTDHFMELGGGQRTERFHSAYRQLARRLHVLRGRRVVDWPRRRAD